MHIRGLRTAVIAMATALGLLLGFVGVARAGCVPPPPDGWGLLGADLAGAPPWVDPCVERRLRMMAGVPAIAHAVNDDAKAYLGDKGPGLDFGLVLADGLFYSDNFGFRDPAKTLTPDETTIFRAGSFSKVITGTALLTLTDLATPKIHLQDEADIYLPELDSVCPNFNAPCPRNGSSNLGIRISHLVSHTSGLPNVLEQGDATVAEWKKDLPKAWVRFWPPGQYSEYSGVGVEAVGLIEWNLSQAASYPDFIRTSLFEPLGMPDSSMDSSLMNAEQQGRIAQAWSFTPNPGGTWSFVQQQGDLSGHDQPMLAPAGGLVTTVFDMSRFLQMFLTNQSPVVNHRPIIQTTTLQTAVQPMFSAPPLPSPPTFCAAATFDSNNPPKGGFEYSKCGASNANGANWFVAPPFVDHNGFTDFEGSQTALDPQADMAATVLISTTDYPNTGPFMLPQPPTLNANFANQVVFNDLLTNGGVVADQASDWTQSPLAKAVARLLYLSGATPPPNSAEVFVGVLPHMPGQPLTPPVPVPAGYIQLSPNLAEPPIRFVYQKRLMAQFTQSFLSQKGVQPINVEDFVSTTFAGAQQCSTFRVRHVHEAKDVWLRFKCVRADGGGAVFDTHLLVDPNGLIQGLAFTGLSTGQY